VGNNSDRGSGVQEWSGRFFEKLKSLSSLLPKLAAVGSSAAVENVGVARRLSNTPAENGTVQTWIGEARL
jgi:hypothetical protein